MGDSTYSRRYVTLIASCLTGDDVDWDIDIKEQLELMSQALCQWRKHMDNFSYEYPYGTNWDFFSFGHCLEAPILSSNRSNFIQGDFYRNEESYYIYPDSTVLPPDQQTETNRKVLSAFGVPPGNRVLSRGKQPICIMGYGVTLEGAQRLLYHFSLDRLGGPLDVEIMVACDNRSLRCLEVNPALIGVYRAPGPWGKVSDIMASTDPHAIHDGDNPMGPRSVQRQIRDKWSRLPGPI